MRMNWEQLLCPDRMRGKARRFSGDLRTEFEKDYHRIINSASFRRLQDKTQVFPLDKSDFIRTRLTHSLEVSSFGKSLGQNVSEKIIREIKDESFKTEYKADVCDILQCAGLLHDIGNPPFGHFGEYCIRQWFRDNMDKMEFEGKPLGNWLTEQQKADFYNFEGNTQALRLVSKLHVLVDDHGMNLTKGLLGTIIKYPVSSLEIDKNSGDIRTKKMGYYDAESEMFRQLQEDLGTNGARHPLTFLLEAADDIAYKTADIEDAYKKGCITFERLVTELRKRGPEGSEYYNGIVDNLEKRRGRAAENGFADPELNAVQNWVIYVQGRMIAAVTDNFAEHYDEIMEGKMKQDLFAETEAEAIMDSLGSIAFDYAFNTKPILKLEIAADAIFQFLLDNLVGAAVNYDTDGPQNDVQKKFMALVSENYKWIYHVYAEGKSKAEKLYLRLLLVTDYICGMTDTFAKDLYQELKGIY